MTQIEVIVQPNGQTKIQTKGFTGTTCRQASQFLEQVMGSTTSEQLTAEFHQSATADVSQKQRT